MTYPEFDAEDLSLLLDGELSAPAADKLHNHMQNHVGTWVQYHNMSALSAACQNLSTPDSNDDDAFLNNLLGCIDNLPASSAISPTFSELSAHYDNEHNPYEESLTITAELEPTLAHMQTLSTAVQSLPSYQPSPDFIDRVMAAIDAQMPTFETLSAYYDGELSDVETQQVLISSQNQASSAHLHNMRVVTGELQALPEYQPSAGFFDNLLQAIDSIPTFAELSAYYDGENPEILVSGSEALVHLHNMKVVTGELQALPEYQPSAGFFDNLLQAIDNTPTFAELSAYYDGENLEILVSGSEAQVHLHNMKVVTGELQALPEYQPSVGFFDNLLQAIDSTPTFAELSAYYDGENPEAEALVFGSEAPTHLHNMKVVTGGLQALPEYQPSPDFLTRLTRELDINTSPPKVFALPQVAWLKNYGRMVAGVAMFGLLAIAGNYFMNTQGTTTANVPTEYIVELENQSEDAIFSEDLVESIETVSNDGYHQLIGG